MLLIDFLRKIEEDLTNLLQFESSSQWAEFLDLQKNPDFETTMDDG